MNTVKNAPPELFILDLDGVLTDGKFIYSRWGKKYKVFGADDHDALNLIKEYLQIVVVTADKRGFKISKRRIYSDMKLSIEIISAQNRIEELSQRYPLANAIYMGDGIHDVKVFEAVRYAIAPANALPWVKLAADFVTNSCGGDRAVAEACRHIGLKFFNNDIFAQSR